MESLWMLAGFVALGVGYLLGHGLDRQRTVEPRAEREHAPTREELDGLRLHIDDAVDKIEHLYDRIRKRYRIEEPLPKEPVTPTDGKAELRAKAAALLFPGRGPIERTNP